MKQSRWVFAVVFALSIAATGFTATTYKILKRVRIGGQGGWDYITADAPARRLYVTHGTQVEVLDLDSLATVGKISGLQGIHGVAIDPALNRGFVSDGAASSVAVIDLKTLIKIADVKAGLDPDAIIFDPATGRIFAFNGRGNSTTVIDAVTNTVVGTIPLDGNPESAVSDGQGRVFVNIEDKNSLAVIDAQSMKVESEWPVGCAEPSGLAMDKAHHRLFVACSNKLMAVLDSASGKLIQTVPIGDHVDAAAFDVDLGLVYDSNGDGTLTVIHEDSPDHYSVIENIPTQRGARTMAVDEKTHHLFTVSADFGARAKPTADHPRPRPSITPGTFALLAIGN